jgi:hypothetical protein
MTEPINNFRSEVETESSRRINVKSEVKWNANGNDRFAEEVEKKILTGYQGDFYGITKYIPTVGQLCRLMHQIIQYTVCCCSLQSTAIHCDKHIRLRQGVMTATTPHFFKT